jgi:hypothetical protein
MEEFGHPSLFGFCFGWGEAKQGRFPNSGGWEALIKMVLLDTYQYMLPSLPLEDYVKFMV